MAMRKYIFAGLDFIFDKEGEPWFIEANGSPRGMRSFEMLFGKGSISKKVANYINKHGKNPCIVVSSKSEYEKNKETGIWVYMKLKEYIPELRMCYSEENRHRRTRMVDSEGTIFRPDFIYRYGQKIPFSFEKIIRMINPTVIRYLAMDKMVTGEMVRKKVPSANVPEAFIVRNSEQLRKKLKSHPEAFKDGFVIKPNCESLGYGVRVFSSSEEKAKVTTKNILQQRIVTELIDDKYWDLRVVLFDGKVMGGYMRISKNRVTNVASGGKVKVAPAKIMKKVTPVSEKIVKAIDDEAVRISKSQKLFRNLKRRIPKTVKN